MRRDPTIAESAKQRSLRVPLGYLARLDALSRVKWLAGFMLGGAAAVYVAWLMTGARAGNRQVSPGVVSAAHAAWNDDCYACHASFRPLRSDAVDLVSLVTGGTDTVKSRTARDQACLKCHNVPAHHTSEKASDVASCAACHREHAGTAASIVRPADSQCTACHADIEQHREGPSGLVPQVASVKFFGPAPMGGQPPHPEFRSLQHDPGNIKFNHWLHLQPGITVADSKRKQGLTDISPDWQTAYSQFAQADGLIQLDCSACHQPDGNGAQMRPIAYEQHCRGCHPLSVALPAVDAATVEIPHGLSADRLAVTIEGLLFQQRRSGLEPEVPSGDESGNAPLIPGRTLGKNLAQKLSQDVLRQRDEALAAAAAKCAQCHGFRAADELAKENALRDVLPANVPSPWLAQARFDHSAHRHVECRTCHAGAYAYEQRDQPQVLAGGDLPAGHSVASDNEVVMIAGLESCVTCHSPKTGTVGGARHDCAECHAYHGRNGAIHSQSPKSPVQEVRRGAERELVRLVSHFSANQTARPHLLGAASCAGAGCHGDARPGLPPWQSAFNTWISRDPHVQAYDVLWTTRGRQMTRVLGGLDATTDDGHRRAVQQRCIGCHATMAADAANEHSLGVECESCHGPAGSWLHAHYRTSFNRTATAGFVDTKDLDVRAAACMGCHVGPNGAAGVRQVVDHDLIAAGHPRLNFEFHSYFQNLPAHWDRSRDKQRYAPEFHGNSWAEGERKHRESLESLAELQPNAPPDFALLDCAACHHPLGREDWRQRDGFSLRTEREPLPELPSSPGTARVTWAKEILAPAIADPQRATTYDSAVRRYLAVRSVMQDFSQPQSVETRDSVATVQERLDELGRYLGRECFGVTRADKPWPSPYELPTTYDPAKLAERVQPLVAALAELEARLAEAAPKR